MHDQAHVDTLDDQDDARIVHPSGSAYYGELGGHVGEATWMALPTIRRVGFALTVLFLAAMGVYTTNWQALRDEFSMIAGSSAPPVAYQPVAVDVSAQCLTETTTIAATVVGIVIGILGSALIAIFIYAQIANARGLRRVVSALTNPFGVVCLLAIHAVTLTLALTVLSRASVLAHYCAGQFQRLTLLFALLTFLSTVAVGFSQAENLSLLLAMNKACRRINSRNAHLFGRATVIPEYTDRLYWRTYLVRLAHGRGRDDFLGPAHDVLTEIDALNDRVLFMKALRCMYRRVALERGRAFHITRWRTPKRLSQGRVPLGARTWERNWYRHRTLHPRAIGRKKTLVQDLELCIIVIDYMIRKSRNLARAGRRRSSESQDRLRHKFIWPMLDFACTLSYDDSNAALIDVVLYGLFYIEREFSADRADGDHEPLRLAGTLYGRLLRSGLRPQAASLCDILAFVESSGDHLEDQRAAQLTRWLKRVPGEALVGRLYEAEFSLEMQGARERHSTLGEDAVLVPLDRRIENPWRVERTR